MSEYFASLDMMTAWTVLITGFVVVFAVLILLIAIIKLYSTIVYNAQNKPKKSKKNNDDDDTPKGTGAGGSSASANTAGGVTPDVLACIAAAVEYMYGAGNVRIRNIKKAPARCAWGNAGVLSNTRPF
ncbi:MAG: OadG family protein [Ruminococcus sp.]|nr:OadG family protein [Ruminococcus sp.]